MDDYESLSHTKWECKYHVVFIPKCRRKVLYGQLRQHLGEVFRELATRKESRIWAVASASEFLLKASWNLCIMPACFMRYWTTYCPCLVLEMFDI